MQSNHKIEIISEIAPYSSNPTEIFNEICGKRPFTLLLESAKVKQKNNLKSIMLVENSLRISAKKQIVTLKSLSKNGELLLSLVHSIIPKEVQIHIFPKQIKLIFPKIKKDLDEDSRLTSLSVFDSFRFLKKLLKNSDNIMKKIFFGGLFSYDLVSYFECLPKLKKKNFPDFCFYLSEILVIFDHQKKTCEIRGILFNQNILEKDKIINKIKKIKKQISKTPKFITKKQINNIKIKCNLSDKKYKKIIKNIQKNIRDGEIFQAVLARKFLIPCIYPLAAYHILKNNNPSPYMFFMQDSEFILFGTSPESSLKYNDDNRKIEIYPIAGTRPRGLKQGEIIDKDLDSRIALEMLLDNKELAEHIMLVDLARNDLARICKPGTRYVSELIKIDRYSFVMHLVSRVVGRLRDDLDIFHAYRACMNMGTLTGAPKVRAMQLIYENEKEYRGSYGGSIGYFSLSGKLDTCIIIRSAYVKNKIAYIQAGAGIVLDSIPQLEADESRNKAKAVLQAIIDAHS